MDADPLSTSLLLNASEAIQPLNWFNVFATLFLVVLNGFFVAAEFAIVKVRMSQVEVQKGINQGVASAAKSILGNLDGYLAATQLGITIASLGLGFLGESVMTSIVAEIYFAFTGGKEQYDATQLASIYLTIKPYSVWLAFAIVTVLHIVFGELAPKSLAIRYPTNTTFFVALPLKIFYIIFRPAIFILNGFANIILKLFGIKPVHESSEIHTEEELKMIITESEKGGAIEETERELIQNVFEFDDRRVSDIFTKRKNISAIDISCTPQEALNYAIQEGYSRYPVYEEDLENIKGVLYTKDLMKQLMIKPEKTTIDGILRQIFYISENAKIKNVLKDFQKKHLQLAIVTNETGEFSGIVTMEDILEELVGEIQDEYDNETPIVEMTPEGKYIINAHSFIADINKFLPYKLEESEHFDTLAGLIAEQEEEKEIKENDEFIVAGYKTKILKMYRNSIEMVEFEVLDNQTDE